MVICECKGLSETEIRRMIREGWNTIALLEVATGVGSECGGCWEGLVRLLDEELGADDLTSLAQPA